jgi:transposase
MLRKQLIDAVQQRQRAITQGYSKRKDAARLNVALIRAQQFLHSYPVANDERVKDWCKAHEDDVRLIVMSSHLERLKMLLPVSELAQTT